MQIQNGHVVEIEYTLRDDDNDVIDSSEGEAPLTYLHGVGQIVPGLERALVGKTIGDALKVSVPPEEGYGMWQADHVVVVPRSRLPASPDPEVGMELEASGPQGEFVLRVIEIEGENVTLDGNHPLAGRTLHFEVTVRGVREATPEEQSHGHAHGEHDHHH